MEDKKYKQYNGIRAHMLEDNLNNMNNLASAFLLCFFIIAVS